MQKIKTISEQLYCGYVCRIRLCCWFYMALEFVGTKATIAWMFYKKRKGTKTRRGRKRNGRKTAYREANIEPARTENRRHRTNTLLYTHIRVGLVYREEESKRRRIIIIRAREYRKKREVGVKRKTAA